MRIYRSGKRRKTGAGKEKKDVHLEVENALFPCFRGGDQVPVEKIQEVLACIGELELDLLALAPYESLFSWRRATVGRLLFLDPFDRAPTRAQRPRDVLVRYRQQVPLFHTQASIRVEDDRLELLNNIFCFVLFPALNVGVSVGRGKESSMRTVPSLGMLCEFGEP